MNRRSLRPDMHRRPHHGFTIIELMVTVVLMGLLIMIALPAFTDFMAAQRIRGVSFDLISDLISARSEALKRGGNLQVAPIETDWAKGWTVTVVSSGEVVRRRDAVGTSVTFAGTPASITFDRDGRVSGAAGTIRITLSSPNLRTDNSRCISLDLTGRPKAEKGACA